MGGRHTAGYRIGGHHPVDQRIRYHLTDAGHTPGHRRGGHLTAGRRTAGHRSRTGVLVVEALLQFVNQRSKFFLGAPQCVAQIRRPSERACTLHFACQPSTLPHGTRQRVLSSAHAQCRCRRYEAVP